METIRVRCVKTAPVMDGSLSGEAWQQTEWYSGLSVLGAPDKKAIPATSFSMIHDNENLYIGIKAEEPDFSGIKVAAPGDNMLLTCDDRLELFLDATGGQGDCYLHLVVNSKGMFASQWLNPWYKYTGCRVRHAVKIIGSSWFAELAIPFAELPLRPGISKWKFNVTRLHCPAIPGKEPYWFSTFAPLEQAHRTYQSQYFPAAELEAMNVDEFLWAVVPGSQKIRKEGSGFVYCQRLSIANMTVLDRKVEIRCSLNMGGAPSGEIVLRRKFGPQEKRTEMLEIPISDKEIGDLTVVLSDPAASREIFHRKFWHTYEEVSWKPHAIKQGDGKGGHVLRESSIQFVPRYEGKLVCPFGIAQMDNGEVVMLGSWPFGDGNEQPVVAFSSDGGATWSEFSRVEGASDRPMMLAYLGNGELAFSAGGGNYRYFSRDYGRTWPEKVPLQPAINGGPFASEGSPLIDRDKNGVAIRIAETGQNFAEGTTGPIDPICEFIRWSTDGGRTWERETMPPAWRWAVTDRGKTHTRSGGEGALVRAANEWIVAALRMDMPPRYFGGQSISDTLEGVGISISKDDGATWTPLKDRMLYDAGRHHSNLLLLPNGDIVMTIIVRADIKNGKLASYRRGCEAIISHDNGLTWATDRTCILDEWEFCDGIQWSNGACGHLYSALLDDGHILTGYGNYSAGGVLIRWKP